MTSLAELLQRSAREHPDRVALIEGELRPTYGQLWELARHMAGTLATIVSAGDRVVLQLRNGQAFVVAYYAVLIAGGVVVPLPVAATDVEVAAVVADSGAVLTLRTDTLPRCLTSMEPVPRNDDDPAAILYTSGTSGDPKGVVLTHGNLLSNATVASRDVARFTADDVMLVTVQFAHAFGMTSVLNACLYAGAALVVPTHWDPHLALELMHRHGVTVVRGVPTTYVDLLAALPPGEPGRQPGPRLRAAFSGGAAMPVALLERVEAAFGTTVWEGYGLTEASPLVACNQRAHGRRAGTVGHAVPGVEIRIADPAVAGAIVDAPAAVGEVVVRGPNVMAGYWQRPAETAAVLVDGWLRTGDLGSIDADGFLRIVDRAKDVIKRGGAAVYPREVEERLIAHAAVRSAAVIGVPDDRYGERVVAAVVATGDIEPAQLTEWCRAALSSYKCPVEIRIVGELPVGPTGKVLKREIRAGWDTAG